MNETLVNPKVIQFALSFTVKLFFTLVVTSVLIGGLIKLEIADGFRDRSAELFSYQKTYGELAETGIDILIADTHEKREKGLSDFNRLRDNQTMLFQFDEVGPHGFWMKDMNFSIDILWLNEYYEIVHIEEKVSPSTYPEIFGKEVDSKYVLETKAGFVEEHSVKLGDVLQVL